MGDGRDHGNLQIMRAGNGDPVNVSVDGNISAHRVQTQGVVINNRLVLNENGTLNQAQWNRHAQLRVLTNTIGRPDLNMYVNYPNRANSKTYLYNDPKVEGTLTVAEDIILGGSRIFDSGMTFTCESGGDPLGSCPNPELGILTESFSPTIKPMPMNASRVHPMVHSTSLAMSLWAMMWLLGMKCRVAVICASGKTSTSAGIIFTTVV